MFESAALATAPSPVPARAMAADADVEAIVPPQPTCLRDTGLERALVLSLIAKTIARLGTAHMPVLAGKLRLSMSVLREAVGTMLAEQLIEVARRGDSDIDIEYQLTGPGQAFAAAALAECRYVGPAPVTLDALRAAIVRDARRHAAAPRIGAAALAAALCDGPGDEVVDAALRSQLGAAVYGGRPLLLHGAPGCGKTTLAVKLGRLLQGVVAVPYAVLIDHRIVALHDAAIHQPPPLQGRQFDERRNDGRWLVCQRPVVRVGAELTRAMLDCRFDAANGIYHAPPQLQASGGLLIIDDLGCQHERVDTLLNRLLGPLERGLDILTLQGGHMEAVPFTVSTVFATSRAPQALMDAGLLRRIAYKVEIGPLATPAYLALLRRQCALAQLPWDEAAAAYLLQGLHAPSGRPMLACLPGELVARIVDAAGFAGIAPRLCPATLDQAWRTLFACCPPPGAASAVADHVQSGEIA